MKYRLNRSFFPWIIAHSLEFWYYYIGAFVSLYFLHHFSSEIPFMAKSLGDLAMKGQLDQIDIKEFFLIAIYILLFRTFSRLLFFYPARIQQRNLRMELVNRLESAPPRNYKSYNEGMIFQTLYNDLNRIRGFMGFALLQLGNIIIAGTIFIPKISSFNHDFIIAFSPLVVCVVMFTILIYFFQPFVKRGMDEAAQVQNFLLESYDAKKTIQNYHAEKDFFTAFNKVSDKELGTFFVSMMGRVISFPLVKVGFGISLIWAALIVKDNGLPGTDLIFFSSFLFLILEPLMFLSWIGIVTSQGYAGWCRIKELTSKLDIVNNEQWLKEYENIESVELPLWESSIKLNLHKNNWNVLIGDTGSGKSWLLEKYAELLTKNNYRYSLIHQEPYLYNDTIENNIFLGLEKTPEKLKLVEFYLKEFGLDVLASSMDKLMKMELGENGKRVSGGQAKRIALIRSLVCDAEFVLWDDPFSSVDLILESQIIEKLKSDTRLSSMTFILSSHRLSTVKNSNHLVYISKSDGVVESGETQELINKGTRTYEFFEKQLV